MKFVSERNRSGKKQGGGGWGVVGGGGVARLFLQVDGSTVCTISFSIHENLMLMVCLLTSSGL